MNCSNIKPESISLGVTDRCCVGNAGCEWDGTLRNVKVEPIFVQKVFDATLVNLQALSTVNNVRFTPKLGRNARIIKISNIRCKKFFNPENINDPRNLLVEPETMLSGGRFVKDGKGSPIEVVGPNGFRSEKIIFADTSECDKEGKGTPVFGTQKVRISGNVIVEIDAIIQTSGSRRRTITLTANVPISPVELTNFFELCIPSIYNSAFFPRFAEFCNILCETRLATNSISRDININPETGEISIDLIIAICISCEKKIIVPVQICVLSTGYPELSPEISPICTTFPSLFPKQIDEDSIEPRPPCKPKFSLDADDFIEDTEDIDFKTFD
ncbi:hypothetical protein EDD65_10232 [Keratinibaculum paraultunense]|uniref:Uncharacterized protein n=1 Tax=Keratinibaculum paraultunense TaxID=1278232 RepID=A0A4R3KYL0_9FIRM|nr:hypothetical protein [Keratinibaculum paraultunense]QQY80393.1 hypothetical protein JL105_03545 [Keratinibaculum paraultunense]TCS91106.1 hypothetical protein EDD65_10232 [Keratinibaculum paraultunense]